jgi:outer membrane protein
MAPAYSSLFDSFLWPEESPMKKQILAAAIAAFAVSGAAVAHEPGDVILRVGAAHVAPDVDSGRIKVGGAKVSGSKADVKDDTQLGLTATWIVAPHLGVELLAATPFTHTIKVKGVNPAIDGTLGKATHLPPTLSAQYFFLDTKSRFQPYVGVGLNYTWFFNEKLSSKAKANNFHGLELENSFGWALQVGADIAISDKLFLNAAVWKIDIDTQAKTRLGNTPVKVDVEVDPWVYFVGIGYKF